MLLPDMRAAKTDQFLELLFPRTERHKQRGAEPKRWTPIKAILDDKNVTPQKSNRTLWALYNALPEMRIIELPKKSPPTAVCTASDLVAAMN